MTHLVLGIRYLDREFFTRYYLNIIKIINYYALANLVFCTPHVNQYLWFYHNFTFVDELNYRTRVGWQDILVNPKIIRIYLDTRLANNLLYCFPNYPQTLLEPFAISP